MFKPVAKQAPLAVVLEFLDQTNTMRRHPPGGPDVGLDRDTPQPVKGRAKPLIAEIIGRPVRVHQKIMRFHADARPDFLTLSFMPINFET
jgi:hypothetical protein